MSVGKMRHKLHVQTQTRTSDGGGSQNVTYGDSFSIFGMIEPKTGSERVFGDQLEERVTHIITTRFNRIFLLKIDCNIVSIETVQVIHGLST